MAQLSAARSKGGAMTALMAKQYEGTDVTSLHDYLTNKKTVTLLPGQTRTKIAAVETNRFEQRLSEIGGKGSKRRGEQRKYLRKVASWYFNDFRSCDCDNIRDAVARLVAVGAVVDPWLKADGTPVDNFPGFRRLGKVAQQDNRDNHNNDRNKTKITRLGKRERNPRPGKLPSNTASATLNWGEEALVVANAAKEGVEVPRRSERRGAERARLLSTGGGARGARRQPLRAEGVECDSCTRNVSDGGGKVYSPHNHATHIMLAGSQLVCNICDKSGRVITDDLVEAGVREEEIPLVARTWVYARCALREDRFGDASFGEAKDIFDEAIAASYDATVDCKEVTDRQQRLAEPAWAEQDPSQRAASRRRRAMRGVFAGDDDDADESASSSDDASARGAVSASPPPPRSPPPSSSRAPPQTPSSQPPPQELASPLSVQSVSSRQSIGTLRERLRERARAARKRRRSSSRASPSPLKRRRRGADADADALVVGAGHEIVRVCSMLSKIARSGSSSSAEAGAALASLKLFLTEV